PGGDAEPVRFAVIVTPRSSLVSPVQSTEAVRSQCGLPDPSTSSPSSAQNAVFSPFTHSLAGWTVKPSLLRLFTAPVGRCWAATIWNVPLLASLPVSIFSSELCPWQPLSQTAHSACCDGSHCSS